MDVTLAKVLILCLVCDIIGIAAGVPLKDNLNEPSNRIKRWAADNISFFGIRPPIPIQDTISSAKQSFNSLGNLFTPLVAPRRNNNDNFYKPGGQSNINNVPLRGDAAASTSTDTSNINKITETSPSSILLPPIITMENTKFNKNEKESGNEKDDSNNYIKFPETDDAKSNSALSGNEYNINKKDEDVVEVDRAIIDSIFRDINRNDIDGTTTTEDTTVDDTTQTGDYESTTTDDLLRIPSAPVVASLLG